jgi:hypothetical protein
MSFLDWKYKPVKSSWPHGDYLLPIISLARQVSADWIIPIAFYRLCEKMDVEQIVNGVTVNGTTVRLDPHDLALVIQASAFLRCDAISQVLEFLHVPLEIEGCRRPTCTFQRLQAHAAAEGRRRTDRGHRMPFNIWGSKDFEILKGVCAACTSWMREERLRALQSLWDRLPGLCDLPGWEELEKRKQAANLPPTPMITITQHSS